MGKKKHTVGILVGIVIVLAAVIILLAVLALQPKENTSGNTIGQDAVLATAGAQTLPPQSDDLNALSVRLNDYQVFSFDDLDFKFIIANIHVEGTAPLNVSLSHFTTSEGIALSDVDSYVNLLESDDYFLGRQNVMFSLISQTSPFDANIFIPIKDKAAASLTVTMDFQSRALSFQTSTATGTKDMLMYKSGDVITDGRSYQMTVSEAREITGEPLYQTVNGVQQEYLLPSTTKVYAFKVQAVSLWGDTIVIEEAQYVPQDSSEVFEALGADITSISGTNMIGQEISDQQSGDLFFYAYDPDDHPITYTGVLKLKIQGQDNWITINVDLN